MNKVDPIGVFIDEEETSLLINEYDLENERIIPLIDKYTDYKEFANKICEIFIELVEIKLNPEEFYDCARNILERVNKL